MIEETKKMTESKRKANKRYNKKNIKTFTLQLNIKTDQDIIEYLATLQNKNGYVKQVIRESMH